jgi:hypothetical protein
VYERAGPRFANSSVRDVGRLPPAPPRIRIVVVTEPINGAFQCIVRAAVGDEPGQPAVVRWPTEVVPGADGAVELIAADGWVPMSHPELSFLRLG